jgi:hypothetical protein
LTATLLDAAMAFAAGAAIFRIADGRSRRKIRGVAAEEAAAFTALEIPLTAAPALAGAVETPRPRDRRHHRRRSIGAPDLAGVPSGRWPRLHLSAGGEGSRAGAALLLGRRARRRARNARAGGRRRLGLAGPNPSPPRSRRAAFVGKHRGGASPIAASAWDALSPEDQAIHLRAQRFARVQVAEMRLHDAAAVQSGRTERDLYGALRSRIDAARAAFRQLYFAQCSNMVDYIHVELVRALAHDDADLLGKDYPGPLLSLLVLAALTASGSPQTKKRPPGKPRRKPRHSL